MLNKYLDTKKSFGLLGKTLKHSYSKEIHEKFGYRYELFEIEEDELPEFLKSRHFLGLNITIPYKEKVFAYCDVIDDIASEIGAVNTLYFDDNRILHATNTDYYGFLEALSIAEINVKEKTVAILGNGGTSKTMRLACQNMGAAKIYIACRNANNQYINNKNSNENHMYNTGMVDSCIVNIANPEKFEDAQIILNATPVGMFPNTEASPLDLGRFPLCEAVFDAVYNPENTLLLKQAEALGLVHASGLHMLYAQALASAKLFKKPIKNK